MPTSNKGPLAGSDLGDDRIYSISDVSEALGIGRQTASRIMRESGRAIRLHSRLYILEGTLLSFLKEKEGNDVRHA